MEVRLLASCAALYPQRDSWYSFLLEGLSQSQDHSAAERIRSTTNPMTSFGIKLMTQIKTKGINTKCYKMNALHTVFTVRILLSAVCSVLNAAINTIFIKKNNITVLAFVYYCVESP
jgi:hypothetical protein